MQPCQGAFAEFVAIPEINLVEVPDQIDLAQAALTEPPSLEAVTLQN